MQKIDKTVLKETLYVLTVSFILSLLMQSVFLVTMYWDYKVVLGNVLGLIASAGNFLLMGISVQKALEKDEKGAKSTIKLSQSLRLIMLLVIAIIGYAVPVFNLLAVVIPYLFPRIAIALRPLFKKRGE